MSAIKKDANIKAPRRWGRNLAASRLSLGAFRHRVELMGKLPGKFGSNIRADRLSERRRLRFVDMTDRLTAGGFALKRLEAAILGRSELQDLPDFSCWSSLSD